MRIVATFAPQSSATALKTTMSRRPLYIALLCLLSLGLSYARSSSYYGLPDSIGAHSRVSILISSPSPSEVYTLYGHAGYRVEDPELGLDVTFNYGIFDFSDDFLLRFVKGKTDYIVVPQATSDYLSSYLDRGSEVLEAELRMPHQARLWAWRYLRWQVEPDNRTYRYNFFYDNCATRLVDITTQALAASSPTTPAEKPLSPLTSITWRDLINRLESYFPWLVLGTDLALGAPTDRPMRASEFAFLPQFIPHVLQGESFLHTSSECLTTNRTAAPEGGVIARITYHGTQASVKPSPWYTYLWHPTVIFSLVLLLALYMTLSRRMRWAMILLFALVGLAGSLLAYIALLSEHPHVWPNYNLLVLHPLHLLLAVPLMLSHRTERWAYRYHFANFVAQGMFLMAAWFLPQTFNAAVYLLSLSLLLLSLAQLRPQVER